MYATIDDIIRANRNAGFHFFDRSTLRFFDSRVHRTVYGGRYFVTSERFPGEPRLYTVRHADDGGDIGSESPFGEFATAAQAHAFARRCAAQDAAGND